MTGFVLPLYSPFCSKAVKISFSYFVHCSIWILWRYVTKTGLVKTFDLLSRSQDQTPPSKVHISYFLQICKKENSCKKWFDLLKISYLQSKPRCQTYSRFLMRMIFLSYCKYLQVIVDDLCMICTNVISSHITIFLAQLWTVWLKNMAISKDLLINRGPISIPSYFRSIPITK